MLARVFLLALVPCLCFGSAALADPPDPAKLERRLGEVEKHFSQALKEVTELRKELKSAVAPVEVKIFRLRHASAVDLAVTLEHLFLGKEGQTLRIIAEPSTNSILILGRPDLIPAVEAVIVRLDEEKPPSKRGGLDKKSSRAELESAVAQQQDRVAWSRRMAKLGYLSEGQAQAEAAKLRSAEAALDKAKTDGKAEQKVPKEPVKKADPRK